jgi:hypothetical protein
MDIVARPGGDGRAGPAAELSRRIAVLAGLAREMGAFLQSVEPLTGSVMKRIARAQIELERAVARILEAEQAWNDWNSGSGAAGHQPGAGGDIDFDAARHEIGCRLARLRECCRPD